MQIPRIFLLPLLLASNTLTPISAVEMKVALKFRTIESPDVHTIELDESTPVPQIREEISKISNIPARLQKLIVRGVMIPLNSPRLAKDISEAGIVIVIRTSEEAIAAAEAAQKKESAPVTAPGTAAPGTAAPGTAAPGAAAPGAPGVAGGNPQDMMGNLMGMAFGNNGLVDLMNNPEIMGALQDMISNPADFQAMISQNPMLQQLAEQNPQVESMIRDPQLLNSLFRPEVMQQVQSFMSAFAGGEGQNGAATGSATAGESGQEQVSFNPNDMAQFFPPGMGSRFPSNNGGAPPPFNPWMNPMMSQIMQQHMNSGGGDPLQNMGAFPPMQQGSMRFPFMQTFPSNVAANAAAPNANSAPAPAPATSTANENSNANNTSNNVTLTEEELMVQIEVLKSMGFSDEAENRRILNESGGDVNAAVNRLLERRSL